MSKCKYCKNATNDLCVNHCINKDRFSMKQTCETCEEYNKCSNVDICTSVNSCKPNWLGNMSQWKMCKSIEENILKGEQ